MRSLITLSLMLSVSVVVSGCASISATRVDRLSVGSNINGAIVAVDGQPYAQTPATIEIDRRRGATVSVAVPGYAPQACRTNMTAAAGYVAADVVLCILLFPLGCLSFIDAGGAWNELEYPSCVLSFDVNNPQVPLRGPGPLPLPPAPPSNSLPPPPPGL